MPTAVPLFSNIYQVIYYVFICFSFPILKKLDDFTKILVSQKFKTEGRSGKNDKHSCHLLYGTVVSNWAKKIIIRESFLSLPSKKVERKSKLKAGQVRIVNILITFFMELRSVIGKKIILLRFILHFWKTQNKPQNTFGYAGMISNICDNISGGWECLENHLKMSQIPFFRSLRLFS